MKKRIAIALAAALMTVSSLSACGSSDTTSSTTDSQSGSSTTSSSDSESSSGDSSADPAAEAIAARTEPQTIVVNWPTYSGTLDGIDRIVEKMNELTIPALNLQVEMQITDFANRTQSVTLSISGGEQIDIISSISVGYTNGIAKDYWEDLEQEVDGYSLLETYGSGIIDTMGWDTLNACRSADGILYGVSQQKENAQGRFALAIGTQYLEAAADYMDLVPDLESDVWRVNGLEDLITILKAAHDANPDMDTFSPGGLQAGWTDVDALGGDYFGVLADYGKGDVVDWFSDDSYLEMVNGMTELYKYGCINPSDLTDTTAANARVKAGSLMSYITNYKPGSDIQESTLCGQDMTIVVGGPDFTASNSIASMPWCICSNTEDIVAAMQYMNFMYTSSEWNELFKWGEKDVDFEEIDGTAKFKEDVEYNHALQWLAPGQFLAMPEYGNPTNLWDVYEEFNANATVSEASGFQFDNSTVATQYTALSNAYTEYQKSIEYGMSDPETAIPEMLDKLNAAGYQEYMAEKQTQLDNWRANNGK